MSVHRCPKHDVLFESNKPPTQDGHAKCPFCKLDRENAPLIEKPAPAKKIAPVDPPQPKEVAGID